MPTKSQSPGPNPAPSTSLSARPKISNPKDKEKGSTTGTGGPKGSFVVEKEQEKKKSISNAKTLPTSTPSRLATPNPLPPKAKDASPVDANAAPTPGPNRVRRRPRKLNKEPVSETSVPTSKTTATEAVLENEVAVAPSPTPTTATATATSTPTVELEALKSRVRGLEARVEELYRSSERDGGGRGGTRSPRRRGKGRKGSNATVTTQGPATPPAAEPSGRIEELDSDDDKEEADEELSRLESELGLARRDLESFRLRPTGRRRPSTGETEFVEEIARECAPGVENNAASGNANGKQVTLTGSYRIPLPSSVSIEDVKSIQSGVSAAQNLARGFLEQRRSQNVQTAVTKEQGEGGGGQSWGEWFGGYSMAISRAAKNIEAEAAVESQRAARPKPAAAPPPPPKKNNAVKGAASRMGAGAGTVAKRQAAV